MRRTITTILAASLALTAAPVLAQEAEESTAPMEFQRAEAPEFGIALELPSAWRVSQPEGLRVSALTNVEGEAVMETTALMANGGGGSWCDVDVYLDLDAPLEQHAYAFVNYLEQSEDADSRMIVVDTEIPVGPAYRIEIFEPANGRIRAMYLFDGPAGEDGLFHRYLFTCASRQADQPFWETIAESIEAFEPVAEPTAEEATADDDMAADEGEAEPTADA